MSWEGLDGASVTYAPSPAESQRFGLTMARVVVGDRADEATAGAELSRILGAAEEDVVVVRWPSRLVRLGAVLARGRRLIIPADVLTYWEIRSDDLAAIPHSLRRTDLHTVVAAADDPASATAISRLVEDSFRSYGNHYAANPALDPELALAGYVDWATRTLTSERGVVVLLRHDDVLAGVATCEWSSDGADLEILLAGLTGEAQGRGWYRRLLSGVGEQARQRGCRRVIISTQAHNVRVQRAWVRAGMVPFAAYTTVHAVSPGVLGAT